MRKWVNTTIRDPFDWRLYVNWLDAVNVVVGWILILDNSLFLTWIGVLLFAVTSPKRSRVFPLKFCRNSSRSGCCLSVSSVIGFTSS